ncbi:hypothetical protein KZ483_17060 [Paenibacillus sp. sptzw28]|uniref:hypothetical protein n=1 Tax=Paenibacillus sp. sptzw28 TaxID=715179 RepID=UPI001C6DFBB0|nr:hypothetical protein [Paenibacillus sp. sptzw28]QYR19604.1 hypothetical protein KZ483_17060 [Paenibacillus sp. sptzw28]
MMKSNHKRLMLILAAAAVVTATAACSKGSPGEVTHNIGQNQTTNKDTNQQSKDGPIGNNGTDATNDGAAKSPLAEQPADDAAGSELPLTDIPVYEGTSKIKMTIDGKEVTAKFESLAPFEPFGLYLPSVLERYDMEDGVEFGYDTRNLITIGPFTQFAVEEASLKKTYEALVPFAEYIGSQPEGGDNPAILTDFFAFEHEGTRYGIRFRYGKDDAATAVPRFLETIRTLKLVTETK